VLKFGIFPCPVLRLYANAHWGKAKKASFVPVALGIVEEKLESGSSKGWAVMIRKVYEIDPGIV